MAHATSTNPQMAEVTASVKSLPRQVDYNPLPFADSPISSFKFDYSAGENSAVFVKEGNITNTMRAVLSYDPIIIEASRRYSGLSGMGQSDFANLIRSVISIESHGNPNVISNRGAVGLMQLEPETAKSEGIGITDLTNPRQNIMGGTHYLALLLDMYKQYPAAEQVRLALASYNAGPGAVIQAINFREKSPSGNYADMVLGYYAMYKSRVRYLDVSDIPDSVMYMLRQDSPKQTSN